MVLCLTVPRELIIMIMSHQLFESKRDLLGLRLVMMDSGDEISTTSLVDVALEFAHLEFQSENSQFKVSSRPFD